MKKLLLVLLVFTSISLAFCSCHQKAGATLVLGQDLKKVKQDQSKIPFDSTLVANFFANHPNVLKYESEVKAIYRKHDFHFLWYDADGLNEVSEMLYSKINAIETEGVKTTIPYKSELDAIFQKRETTPNPQNELLISALYFFYANKVYQGLDATQTSELGWYLPRKKQSYVSYLDSILHNPSLMHQNEKEVVGQYFRLKSVLQQYRAIEQKGAWEPIAFEAKTKALEPGDSAVTVAKIRQRLFLLGMLQSDSKSNIYDEILSEGILKYKQTIDAKANKTITPKVLAALSVPIADRIKTIMVNMERCRWVPGDLAKSKEFIVINIPAYRLSYFKNGKPELISKVVVGKAMNQTVVFSGMMQYIVFSPYWNVPKSIVQKELLPEIAKNKNYLSQHNMEWNNGNLRQKPGPKNSLGLVKFLFPNSNNIYLHDTPAKTLFNEQFRAFSHGCIRVEKPVELANLILKEDKNWTPEKIDAAMHKGEESWYTLKNTIPVYIGYFTTWVDTEGTIHFYDDVYQRDERLAALIFQQ